MVRDVLGQYIIWKRKSARYHMLGWGELNCASLSTHRLIDYLKSSKDKRGEEIDYIQPSIPHSETRQQRKEKKKGGVARVRT